MKSKLPPQTRFKPGTPAAQSRLIAAALEYDDCGSRAPMVCAAGQGDFAKQLLAVARRYGVPIEQRPELAAQLQELAVSEEIPQHLFDEVASVFVTASRIGPKPDSAKRRVTAGPARRSLSNRLRP